MVDSDRVLVMDAGAVAEYEDPKTLLANRSPPPSLLLPLPMSLLYTPRQPVRPARALSFFRALFFGLELLHIFLLFHAFSPSLCLSLSVSASPPRPHIVPPLIAHPPRRVAAPRVSPTW